MYVLFCITCLTLNYVAFATTRHHKICFELLCFDMPTKTTDKMSGFVWCLLWWGWLSWYSNNTILLLQYMVGWSVSVKSKIMNTAVLYVGNVGCFFQKKGFINFLIIFNSFNMIFHNILILTWIPPWLFTPGSHISIVEFFFVKYAYKKK